VTGAALMVCTDRARAAAVLKRVDRAMHERFRKDANELKLTDQQTTSVRTILDETRNEYRTLRTELRPRFEEPRMKREPESAALLTPEQQQKFDALVAQQVRNTTKARNRVVERFSPSFLVLASSLLHPNIQIWSLVPKLLQLSDFVRRK